MIKHLTSDKWCRCTWLRRFLARLYVRLNTSKPQEQTDAQQKKIRVLYVDTLSSPHAQTNTQGLTKAYKKTADLTSFDYRSFRPRALMNEVLFETAIRFQPDLIHLGKAECIQGETIRRIKEHLDTCVIHFYGDYRPDPQPWVVDISRYADLTLLYHKDPNLIQKHREAGVGNIGFWWPGTDPDTFYPRPELKKEHDVVFMANNADFLPGHRERRECVEAIAAKGYSLHIYGRNWEYLAPYDNVYLHDFVNCEQFAEACSRAKITLGFDPVSDVYMYASWRRPLNSMAAGAFHLTHQFPGLETVFENRKHLVLFHNIPEALESIEYYLSHEEEREEIAAAGRKEVLAHHTWDHRVKEMFAIMEETTKS